MAKKRRECSNDFVQLHQKLYEREPSDVDIMVHLKYQGRLDVVSSIKPNEHSKVDELTKQGVKLVELASTIKYYWANAEVVETLYVLKDEVDITFPDIMVGNASNFLVILVDPAKRVCISLDGCSIPLYECLFTRLGVRFPFSDFEVVVLNQLKVLYLSFIWGHGYA